MSTEKNQSAIREVRDQLALDTADGDHLNVVSSNLGMDRPIFGFTDDSWRALVKAIALRYKQVRPQFNAVLGVLFGPQFTEVTTLAADVLTGDRSCTLTDATNLPQLGTLILDAGLATEETLEYCFIDRGSNTLYLTESAGFAFDHTAVDQDAEQPILAIDENTGTTVVLPTTRGFPTAGLPYTAVIGRTEASLDDEVSVEVTAVDQTRGTLTLASALVATPRSMTPSVVQTTLALPYAVGAPFLVLTSTSAFSGTGYVLLDYKTGDFVADGAGTTTTVTAPAGSFAANVHSLLYVKFVGDVTPALAGVEVEIASNTSDTLTFSSAIGTAPADGDTFQIYQPPFNVVSGTVTTATVNGGTFTVGRQVGNVVEFEGNVAPTLAGVTATIVENSASVLTFGTTLPTSPLSGDRFRIRQQVEYTSNDVDNSALNLHLPLFDMLFPSGALVELLDAGATAAVGQVQVTGCRWDLFEVTPKQLDIYLPEKLLDIGDLRSASYLHTSYVDPVPSTTLSAPATAGDTSVAVTSHATFPIVGVIVLDPGGVEERVAYYKDNTLSTGSIDNTGATVLDGETFTLDDGVNPAVVFEFDNTNSVVQSNILRKVDISTLSVRDAIVAAVQAAPVLDISAAASPLSDSITDLTHTAEGTAGNVAITETVVDASFVVSGMSGGDTRLTIASQGLANSFAGATSVELYEPRYGATEVLDGDVWGTPDVFPGPYLYDREEDAPTGTVAITSLSAELIPGPSTVEVDQLPGNSALEVENAMAMDWVNFPYDVIVGRDTGNRETVTVTDVNLRSRVTATAGVATAGDTFIPVSSLSGGTADEAADFPDARGYRVLITGGSGEVVYVIGTTTTPSAGLLIQEPLVTSLAGTEELYLLADVLSTNTLADFHEGEIAYEYRATAVTATADEALFPPRSTTEIVTAEIVEPQISSFDLASTAGLDTSGGTVILNFGEEQLPQEDSLTSSIIAGATTLPLVDSSGFPTTYPYIITLSPGDPVIQERHLVTFNDTGIDTLTINSLGFGVISAHAAGAAVTWDPGATESVEYDSISASTLSFSPAIVLQSTHSPVESAIDSSTGSNPSTDGYDFPFRMPPDIRERIRFLFDLLRAAGVQVEFIDQR